MVPDEPFVVRSTVLAGGGAIPSVVRDGGGGAAVITVAGALRSVVITRTERLAGAFASAPAQLWST